LHGVRSVSSVVDRACASRSVAPGAFARRHHPITISYDRFRLNKDFDFNIRGRGMLWIKRRGRNCCDSSDSLVSRDCFHE
jgi:hypothetical protein